MENPIRPTDTGTVKRAGVIGILMAAAFVLLLLRILKYQTLDYEKYRDKVLNQIMYCEVMDEEMGVMNILGLTPEELRSRSHNPQKYFNIKQMLLPNYTMGVDYTKLNVLRAKVRELELAALDCFVDGKNVKQPEIIRTLNRLSSALHIMMCMYLAGEYK